MQGNGCKETTTKALVSGILPLIYDLAFSLLLYLFPYPSSVFSWAVHPPPPWTPPMGKTPMTTRRSPAILQTSSVPPFKEAQPSISPLVSFSSKISSHPSDVQCPLLDILDILDILQTLGPFLLKSSAIIQTSKSLKKPPVFLCLKPASQCATPLPVLHSSIILTATHQLFTV